MRVVFTPEADAQLLSIFAYIAGQAGPDLALRFTDEIVSYCEGFTTFPSRGTLRDDLRPGLRTIGYKRRVTIAFAVLADAVTIIGVFYGGQDFESALAGEDGTVGS